MEAGHFGKDAMDMMRLEHALPCGDLHRPRVGSKTAEQSCSVCLKNFEEDDYIWSMPCSHTFHQLCVLGDRSCRVCHPPPPAPPSTDEKPEASRTTQ
uniref:RING-type domain-containing protein n=1 Tax=Oryza glumipatula TaxID=40148 RepID=A0A0E0BNT4_9ORYZ